MLYGCSQMILLSPREVSLNSNTSTGSDVIMTSNCIYDITYCIRTVKTTNDIKGKIPSGRCLICMLREQGFKFISSKETLKHNNNKAENMCVFTIV